MTRHWKCTHPACDCIKIGSKCKPAEAEREKTLREEREANEPFCSVCHLPESRLSDCTRTACVDGIAHMVQP
jgi:hypothetical protein